MKPLGLPASGSFSSDLSDAFSKFDFAGRKTVVAAVSGGSDSTALLLLLHRYFRSVASRPRLVAVTVDHRLRPESASEADAVAAFAGRLGIEHRTLLWEGPKPAVGKAAAARTARYRLLAQTARALGTDLVVTGHTADDQAETVAMRLQRGPGPGLAGMAAVTLFEQDIWVLRPLLATGREGLRDGLRCEGVTWAEDPGNTDIRTERARVRQALTLSRRSALSALQAEWMRRRTTLSVDAARLIETHADMPLHGIVHIAPPWLDAKHRHTAVHGLAALLAVMGGVAVLPNPEKVARILANAERGPCRQALARSLLVVRRDGLWLTRETRDLPSASIDDGVWDDRYRMRPGQSVAPRASASTLLPVGPPTAILAAALAAFPPAKAGQLAQPVMAPWARVLSGFDLPLAQAIARLLGAPPIPPAPIFGSGTGP